MESECIKLALEIERLLMVICLHTYCDSRLLQPSHSVMWPDSSHNEQGQWMTCVG